MSENEQKQLLSIAHLHLVASAAGFAFLVSTVDDDSVDGTILARGWLHDKATVYSPKLDVQLKCTARAALTRGERSFKLELRKKNYDELRLERPHAPRLLVVMLVPKSSGRWLSHGDKQTVVRHAAYFVSLHGMPERDNLKYSVTVEIPRKNMMTPRNLQRLMGQVAMQQWRLE